MDPFFQVVNPGGQQHGSTTWDNFNDVLKGCLLLICIILKRNRNAKNEVLLTSASLKLIHNEPKINSLRNTSKLLKNTVT